MQKNDLHLPATDAVPRALRQGSFENLPEYLIEAFALGLFMIVAGGFTWLLEAGDSPLHGQIGDGDLRRALNGIAMGLTAIALVYSPWGKRSGAHLNPAVTLTFLTLGKITPRNAAGYVVAQFAGGILGVLIIAMVLRDGFTGAPVNFVRTMPGEDGPWVAFLAEVLIAFVMMSCVLVMSNRDRLMNYTGIASGCLVAAYITFEAPISGMSLNPARSFASASVAGDYTNIWIYFIAPTLGMLFAAFVYRRLANAVVSCAKLFHARDQRCIHCGYEPVPSPETHLRSNPKCL